MSEPKCENCKMRANYDKKPNSLMGRFWRWHIGWCPGWKGYMKSVTAEKRAALTKQYNLD